MSNTLKRFIEAQENKYDRALAEVRSGRKQTHWIWFIFPQFTGLGDSPSAEYYAIKSVNEAKEYLNHEILGARLREISNEILKLENTDDARIFGYPDNMKVHQCMTLFSYIDESDDKIFKRVIDKYFEGSLDVKTIELIEDDLRNN